MEHSKTSHAKCHLQVFRFQKSLWYAKMVEWVLQLSTIKSKIHATLFIVFCQKCFHDCLLNFCGKDLLLLQRLVPKHKIQQRNIEYCTIPEHFCRKRHRKYVFQLPFILCTQNKGIEAWQACKNFCYRSLNLKIKKRGDMILNSLV